MEIDNLTTALEALGEKGALELLDLLGLLADMAEAFP